MEVPLVCPICHDWKIEIVEGVELWAKVIGLERTIGNLAAYRCPNWHVFTVFSASRD